MAEGDMSSRPGLPGVPLSSGFSNWRPASEHPALRFTAQEMREWQAWLDEVKRSRLRAMEGAMTYVIG